MTERDPLELLHLLAGGVDPQKCSPFQAMAREFALEAIAAWEKERAAWEDSEMSHHETIENLIAQRDHLRAALERIEGEIIELAGTVSYQGHPSLAAKIHAHADSIRAAREGGK